MGRSLLLIITLLLLAPPVGAQSPAPSSSPSSGPEKSFIKSVVRDQKAIWSSPFRLKARDLRWLGPVAAVSIALVASDRESSSWVSESGSLPSASRYVSLGGSLYGTAGVAGAFYIAGRATGNRRARETGVLAAEALIDATVVTNVLKLTVRRARPDVDGGQGRFFVGGQSFPSGHSTAAWSVATVIAHEYDDKPVIKYGAYTGAVLVSLSRYSGRRHFLSDIMVGGAIGYLTGRFVFKRHHGQSIGKGAPETSKLVPSFKVIRVPRTGMAGATATWTF